LFWVLAIEDALNETNFILKNAVKKLILYKISCEKTLKKKIIENYFYFSPKTTEHPKIKKIIKMNS